MCTTRSVYEYLLFKKVWNDNQIMLFNKYSSSIPLISLLGVIVYLLYLRYNFVKHIAQWRSYLKIHVLHVRSYCTCNKYTFIQSMLHFCKIHVHRLTMNYRTTEESIFASSCKFSGVNRVVSLLFIEPVFFTFYAKMESALRSGKQNEDCHVQIIHYTSG